MSGSVINHTASLEESDPQQPASASAPSPFPALRLESRSLITSASMFAVGVLGNVIAIVVLCVSKREQKETTFYTLVCGMAVTDLLGTCLTSPVVIATYVSSRWPGGALLCHFFSFSMLFFGCAGMSILCAMAVERYLAISHAYFYSQHVDRATARAALLAAYLATVVLSIMPSFGFGQHARHFPGTWCFLDWRAADALAASYSFLYGGVMLLLIAVTVLCNLAVCRSLVGMRQRACPGRGQPGGELCGARSRFPRLSTVTSAAEIQMFWLLIFMTIVFLVCSVPLVVRIFVNQLQGPVPAGGVSPDYRSDLLAIRFASFNPILDPWVYILCRKNLLLRGCQRLKRAAPWAQDGRRHDNSPASLRSNDTSYASLRTASCRTGALQQQQRQQRLLLAPADHSFCDLALRQAWEMDTARAGFHPFSVQPEEDEEDEGFGQRLAAKACPGAGSSKVHVVACTFSTPSSGCSHKSI